jgi:hypothetical protein
MANFVVAAFIVSGMDTAALADFPVCNHPDCDYHTDR